MLKPFKMTLLSACAVAGLALYSCSKQNDPSVNNTTVVATQTADLATQMAADAMVQKLIADNNEFVNAFSQWFIKASKAERAAYQASYEEAMRNGNAISDPTHSVAETQAFHAAQTSGMNQIKAKYPQFASLSGDKVELTLFKVNTLLLSQDANKDKMPTCGGGYLTCVHAGGNSDICWGIMIDCLNHPPY